MKKEGHGAARRNMIIGFGGLVENGKHRVYGLGKSFGRIRVIEENIGPRVIKIKTRETELRSWETWFGMWTTIQTPVGGLVDRAPDRECLKCLLIPSIFPLFLSFGSISLIPGLLGADRKRRGNRFGWGSGHGEGCW